MTLPEKNWLEWTVFFAGACLIVAVLGFLIYDAAILGDAPPMIEVRLGASEMRVNNFTVPVTVINHGDEIAEGVQVEVELKTSADGEPEKVEFVIPFLPRRATREGSVTFRHDPRAGELQARVTGYGKP